VAIKQTADDFARYVYLPRLKDPSVLAGAIRDGVSLLTGERETFALANSFDEATGRRRIRSPNALFSPRAAPLRP
jgi:hypothetical protein